jgi:uncharacterized protein (DUF362 family)
MEALAMDNSVKVAVVRGTSRRGAVAEVLALLDDDVRKVVTPQVLIKPNLVSQKYQPASTHVDAFSATLDAVLAAGAERVVVAEGASDATAGFERFGFRGEAWNRPVRFLDLNRDEDRWEIIELRGLDGSTRKARLSRTVAESPCRVSLGLAKTHVTSIVTLSLKNMLSSLHPDDRVMMHGLPRGGNGYLGWKRFVVELLKQDNPAVRLLTRMMGRVRNFEHAIKARFRSTGVAILSAKERNFLRTVVCLNQNVVTLSQRTKPHLSIIDGWLGMHREGPRHGTSIKLKTVIAGTDAVAVDAVASAVMGFDPWRIGYLAYAQAAGLGIADLGRITIVGDPIAMVRKPFVPHSNYPVQRLWGRAMNGPWSGTHKKTPAARRKVAP